MPSTRIVPKANKGETKPANFNDKEMLSSIEPAANRGAGDMTSPASEFDGGSRGIHSGVNVQEIDAVSGKP